MNDHLQKIYQDLVERDKKDAKIDQENREKLLAEGLELRDHGPIIEVDSGKIIGVENVVDVIVAKLPSDVRCVSLVGESGSGKSSTALSLAKRLDAVRISNGEIFRYLTYCYIKDPNCNLAQICQEMYYRVNHGLELHHNDIDVSADLQRELTDLSLEPQIPSVADKIQKNVIEFINREIIKLENENHKIVLEGRAFTLDFLTSDARIKLVADAHVRAERRAQER